LERRGLDRQRWVCERALCQVRFNVYLWLPSVGGPVIPIGDEADDTIPRKVGAACRRWASIVCRGEIERRWGAGWAKVRAALRRGWRPREGCRITEMCRTRKTSTKGGPRELLFTESCFRRAKVGIWPGGLLGRSGSSDGRDSVACRFNSPWTTLRVVVRACMCRRARLGARPVWPRRADEHKRNKGPGRSGLALGFHGKWRNR